MPGPPLRYDAGAWYRGARSGLTSVTTVCTPIQLWLHTTSRIPIRAHTVTAVISLRVSQRRAAPSSLLTRRAFHVSRDSIHHVLIGQRDGDPTRRAPAAPAVPHELTAVCPLHAAGA